MTLSKNQVAELLRMLKLTKDTEATCGDCQNTMAEFAETQLEGKTIPESLNMIKDHLQLCGDCREEFEALLAALQDL